MLKLADKLLQRLLAGFAGQLAAHRLILGFGRIAFGAAADQLDNLPAFAGGNRRRHLAGLQTVQHGFDALGQHAVAHTFNQAAVGGAAVLRVAAGDGGKVTAFGQRLGNLRRPLADAIHLRFALGVEQDAAHGVSG